MQLVIRSDHMQEVAGVTAEYPYVLNRVDSRQTQVPWHWHEELEFSFVRQGALRVAVSGRNLVFSEGEGFFLNANILHCMAPAETNQVVRWDSHMFHPTFLGGYYRSVFDTKYLSPVLKNRNFPLAAFRGENETQAQILELLQQAAAVQSEPDSEMRTRNLFSELWLLLRREMQRCEQLQEYKSPVSQERIQCMLAYIHTHYQEKLTLEQIAASASVSKRECLRCFQNCIQCTPLAYVLDYRIQMAERLLWTTNLPVTQIAALVGIENSAYFSKLYRQLRGMTPGQYRKRRKGGTGVC